MPILCANGKTILFIHIPKTGGTSITEMLQKYGQVGFNTKVKLAIRSFRPRHMHREPLTQLFPKEMFDFSFLVVRHPVSRMVS